MRTRKDIFLDHLKKQGLYKRWCLRSERLERKYFETHQHLSDNLNGKISYEEFLRIDHERRLNYHIEKYGFNKNILFIPALLVHGIIEFLDI